MPAQKRPNFLIIVTDDLGFSDPGCFGGEIRTPNLDKMAAEGLRFTEFHTASMCSPTRSMIMSGTDNHIAGVGAMVEEQKMEFGARWRGKPGYEGYLVPSVASMPEVLRDNGYHTVMSGKWHLGRELDQIPGARGFDRSFSMLSAFHNHYAWEPQWEVGNKHDDFIADWHPAWYTKHNTYTRDQAYDLTVEANFPKKKGGFYSTVNFTEQMLEYLKEWRGKPDLREKPFFAYLPFTAPHYPLQAEKEYRDHWAEQYKGMYDDGPNALRLRRLERLKKMGLIDPDIKPHEMVDMWGKGDWEKFSPDEKAKSARAMETYSAMVEVIDQQIGRVIEDLKANGELDNTFVMFMADNGAEGASYEAIPCLGYHFMSAIARHYDNSLENIGEPNSFVWYGTDWAQASTAPSRLFKAWTSEGGIRVPCIIRYPPFFEKSGFKPGQITSEFGTCMDIMPTLLDLSGSQHPASEGKPASYKGREVVPMRGKPWGPWFRGEASHVHDTVAIPQGWELHGRAAIRKGEWKILFMPPPGGKGTWELFNLKQDPGETTDLSQQYPDTMKEMLKDWEEYMNTSQVVWKADNPYVDGVEQKDFTEGDEMDDPRNWMDMKGQYDIWGSKPKSEKVK